MPIVLCVCVLHNIELHHKNHETSAINVNGNEN